MAATTTCLELAEGDREELEGIARTGTEMARRVDRARMLLAKAGGESAAPMAARLGVDPNTAELCVRKYRDGGLGRRLPTVERIEDELDLQAWREAKAEFDASTRIRRLFQLSK